jgi:hypothetical protein
LRAAPVVFSEGGNLWQRSCPRLELLDQVMLLTTALSG